MDEDAEKGQTTNVVDLAEHKERKKAQKKKEDEETILKAFLAHAEKLGW